jgi:serine/threonine protein kinase
VQLFSLPVFFLTNFTASETAVPEPSSAPPATSTPPPPFTCDCGGCGCCPGCFYSRFNNSCIGCPAGTISSICQDNNSCDECPPGDYCPNSHMSTPLRCPSGYFAEAGAVTCTPCSASDADQAQCPVNSLSSQFELDIIIALCLLGDLFSAFWMFRHVRSSSRTKPVFWAILALILGPFAWFLLWMYKRRPSGYVRQTDHVQSAHIRRSDIVIDSTLAPSQGGFGQVFRGHLNGSLVAVKEILVFPLSEKDERAFHHEAKVMRSITHANCVRLEGTCAPPDRFALVMEWMDGGNFYEALGRLPPNQPPPFHKRITVMRQISVALHHLHSKDIIHGDLKSMNIMLSDPNCDGEAKLADFGLSRMRTSLSHIGSSLGGVGGSYHYQSPEMLCLAQPCSFESDIYAFGMLLYEAALGRKAWDGLTFPQVLSQLQQGNLPAWDPNPPAGISDEYYNDVKDLVRQCCDRDPNQRIKALVVTAKLAVLDVNNPALHTPLLLVPHGFQSPCTTLMQCLNHANATSDPAIIILHTRVDADVRAKLLEPRCVQFMNSNNLLRVEAECIAAYTWDDPLAYLLHTPFRAFNSTCRKRDIQTLFHWRHFAFHFLNGLRFLSVTPCLLLRITTRLTPPCI